MRQLGSSIRGCEQDVVSVGIGHAHQICIRYRHQHREVHQIRRSRNFGVINGNRLPVAPGRVVPAQSGDAVGCRRHRAVDQSALISNGIERHRARHRDRSAVQSAGGLAGGAAVGGVADGGSSGRGADGHCLGRSVGPSSRTERRRCYRSRVLLRALGNKRGGRALIVVFGRDPGRRAQCVRDPDFVQQAVIVISAASILAHVDIVVGGGSRTG